MLDEKVYIDVGASDGSLSKHILRHTDTSLVYAIEPNSNQYEEKLIELEHEYPSQFKWRKFALSDFNGSAKFFGSSIFKGLVGSLNEFNQEKIWDQSLSSHFISSDVQDYDYVEVTSVSKFVNDEQITSVEFLKIDAQGSDLKILEQFLNHVEVKCAVVEVNSSIVSSENAYLVENSFEKLIKICELNSMSVIKIIPATSDLSEYNVIIGKDQTYCLYLIDYLRLEESMVLGRFWKVLGLGTAQKNSKRSYSLFLTKFLQGLKHPVYSAKSVIFKLTR
jgi:FkbM family methyltransferase